MYHTYERRTGRRNWKYFTGDKISPDILLCVYYALGKTTRRGANNHCHRRRQTHLLTAVTDSNLKRFLFRVLLLLSFIVLFFELHAQSEIHSSTGFPPLPICYWSFTNQRTRSSDVCEVGSPVSMCRDSTPLWIFRELFASAFSKFAKMSLRSNEKKKNTDDRPVAHSLGFGILKRVPKLRDLIRELRHNICESPLYLSNPFFSLDLSKYFRTLKFVSVESS